MAKSKSDKPDPALITRLKEHAGEGLSDKTSDNAFWLGDIDDSDEPWLDALQAIDQRGDKQPLIDLLRSDAVLTDTIRHFLADLVERGVPRPSGRPRRPAYDESIEALLQLAVDEVRHLLARGKSRDEALRGAATKFSPAADGDTMAEQRQAAFMEKIENLYAGRRGSARRAKSRRSPQRS